eukprot:gene36669-45233_t
MVERMQGCEKPKDSTAEDCGEEGTPSAKFRVKPITSPRIPSHPTNRMFSFISQLTPMMSTPRICVEETNSRMSSSAKSDVPCSPEYSNNMSLLVSRSTSSSAHIPSGRQTVGRVCPALTPLDSAKPVAAEILPFQQK